MPRALLLSLFPSSDHPLTRPPVYSCTRIRPSLTPCVQVLLVEWAPVEWLGAGTAQSVKLRDLLRVDGRRSTPVRIITVPAAHHDRLRRTISSNVRLDAQPAVLRPQPDRIWTAPRGVACVRGA